MAAPVTVVDWMREPLLAYLEKLRAIFKESAPEEYERFPNQPRPCHTCALNRATDRDRGFVPTALRLWSALTLRQVFYCHDNMPLVGGDYMPALAPELHVCMSWLAVWNDPRTKLAGLALATDLLAHEGGGKGPRATPLVARHMAEEFMKIEARTQ